MTTRCCSRTTRSTWRRWRRCWPRSWTRTTVLASASRRSRSSTARTRACRGTGRVSTDAEPLGRGETMSGDVTVKDAASKVRLHLTMNEATDRRLEELMRFTEADSKVEVIRRALALYDMVVKAQHEGRTLV